MLRAPGRPPRLGLAALATSAAVTSATGTARSTSPTALIGDVAAHLASGAVATFTPDRLLDSRTPHADKISGPVLDLASHDDPTHDSAPGSY